MVCFRDRSQTLCYAAPAAIMTTIPPHLFQQSRLLPGYQRDWPAYFDAVKDQPPRDTLLRALRELTASPLPEQWLAIDIACGEGRDTRAILAASPAARVLAIDSSHEALARLRNSLSAQDTQRVTNADWPMEHIPTQAKVAPNSATLINASFALPFCHEDYFPTLWQWITTTLRPAGHFAGQIFGDRDDWTNDNPRRHFSRAQVESLLAPFNIAFLDEVEKDAKDAMGGVKHYHIFHIVAQKR